MKTMEVERLMTHTIKPRGQVTLAEIAEAVRKVNKGRERRAAVLMEIAAITESGNLWAKNFTDELRALRDEYFIGRLSLKQDQEHLEELLQLTQQGVAE